MTTTGTAKCARRRLPAGPLTVDAGQNGGIRVEGWDGSDIRVRAVVQASAREEADAKRLASEVEVQAGGGRVSATGPRSQQRRREWWSVSYRISVPRRTDLDLNANNGGITIVNVAGTIRFDTTNGGVRLADVGGSVNGRTRNGGVRSRSAAPGGTATASTSRPRNGGVTLSIPEPYNAQLETRTVNGGFRFDYPLTHDRRAVAAPRHLDRPSARAGRRCGCAPPTAACASSGVRDRLADRSVRRSVGSPMGAGRRAARSVSSAGGAPCYRGAIPMANTTTQSLRQLSADDVTAALGRLRARQPVKYAAFYSSQLGGMVTDPALMVIPFDDHMVHRGHGIFDTAGLVDGKIYDLEAHLDRFHRSAEHSRLTMPASRAELRDIIIATVAASRRAQRLDSLLAVVRARQPRPEPRGRRRAGLLRDGVPGPRPIRNAGTPKGSR